MASSHATSSYAKSSAVKALALEYKNMVEEPLEGFQVKENQQFYGI